jgi:hypothetical protein
MAKAKGKPILEWQPLKTAFDLAVEKFRDQVFAGERVRRELMGGQLRYRYLDPHEVEHDVNDLRPEFWQFGHIDFAAGSAYCAGCLHGDDDGAYAEVCRIEVLLPVAANGANDVERRKQPVAHKQPTAHKHPKLAAAIDKRFKEGRIPGRKGLTWKVFCNIVRDACGVNASTRDYSDRTIRRIVQEKPRQK